MAFLQTNATLVFALLFAVDQLLAAIPSVKSNSIFQLITNILGAIAPKGPVA